MAKINDNKPKFSNKTGVARPASINNPIESTSHGFDRSAWTEQ